MTANHIDLPSFSLSLVDSQDDETFSINSEAAQRFLRDNADLARIISMLSYNQGYLEILDQLIAKVDNAIEQNRSMQSIIRSKLLNPSAIIQKQRVMMNLPCWPPYFKDSAGMMPNMNKEALEIDRICEVNPLIEEEKKWNQRETDLLQISVCESLKDQEIYSLDSRKELLINKLRSAGVETTNEQKLAWLNEIGRMKRRVTYIRERPIDEYLRENTDYSRVDWAKISARDCQGLRSIAQLRQKWSNELAPHFNKEPFTDEEDEKMVILAKDFSNWDTIAQLLGTNRSAFQCFQRHIYIEQTNRETRPWTPDEDQKLRELVRLHKVGEEIPWAKISMYMPGRNKQSCRYRYQRSLNVKLRHGRWTEAEDMLLLEAINKYGPQNWVKISDNVKGRSALQCRDRWVHVLDSKRRDQPWTWEEYQRLLNGIRLFGRDECAKIAKLIPGRNNMDVRLRIRLLIKYQIEKVEKPNKKVPFRHFSSNYLFCKNRRQTVVEEFNKFIEMKQNDRKNQMVSRLGLGSFVMTSQGGLDYSKVKKERTKEFNHWQIQGSGRWIKAQQKNPNEYDREDLMNELDQLPNELREKTLSWLEESDRRLEAEREAEKNLPDDPNANEAMDFYDQMFPKERMDELAQHVRELLPPREHELRYYHLYKKRPPKIRIKKRAEQKKPKKKAKRRKRMKKSKLMKMLENMDEIEESKLEGLRWSDRLMVEVYKEIDGMEPAQQRQYLITRLCCVVRQRVHIEAQKKYRYDYVLQNRLHERMIEYVKQVVEDPNKPEPEAPEPAEIEVAEDTKQVHRTVVLPTNWQNMSMKEMIRLKISPQMLQILAQQAQNNGTDEQQQSNANVQQTNQPQFVNQLAQQIEPRSVKIEPQTMTIGERVRKRRRSGQSNNLSMDRFASTIIMPFVANQIPEQPQPTRSPAIKRSRADNFKPEPLEKILSKLLPPSSATLNVVDAYNTRVREVLKKEIGMYHYLQKLANDPNVPGTSNQTNCIGENPVTDEMRSTLDYINLKKRIYRLFFLPMAMINATNDRKSVEGVETEENDDVADEDAGDDDNDNKA